MQVDLTGKTAVVTGAGGILCSVMAKALAKAGAKVALLDLALPKAQQFADEINASGGKAIAVEANVLDPASLKAAAEKVEAEFGGCDILVNGAGGNNPKGTTSKEYLEPADLDASNPDVKTFFDLDPNGIAFVFGLNFNGTLLTTQAFAKSMAKRGGTIINISSMNAFTPLTKIPASSAAQAAVSNFTRGLAVHFSKVGIRVNAIAPGFFLTAQNHALLVNPDGTPSARAKKILAHTPMERFGTPEDLTGSLLFLADASASAFVNGVVLPVDGAFSAYSGV